MLWLLVRCRQAEPASRPALRRASSILSAVALSCYALAFSLAYTRLSTASGALLLFGTVQVVMIGYGLARGEPLSSRAQLGLLLAAAGLAYLLLPGVSAPPLVPALLMLVSGGAWAAYSLLGRRSHDPMLTSSENFMMTLPVSVTLLLLSWNGTQPWTPLGLSYALLSGALTSGLGYAVWYAVLPSLSSFQAAGVQLLVPVLAALAGVALLDETLTPRLLTSSVVILGGVVLSLLDRRIQTSTKSKAPR